MAFCPTCHKQLAGPDYPCTLPRCVEQREAARAVGDTTYREAKQMYAAPQDPTTAEAYWQEGHPPYYPGESVRGVDLHAAYSPDLDAVNFVQDVLAEVDKARAKFPNQDSKITGLALGEEAGEAVRALLHIHEGKSGEDPLYLECVQTAAMALRLATERADRETWLGNERKRIRDELAGGGPKVG